MSKIAAMRYVLSRNSNTHFIHESPALALSPCHIILRALSKYTIVIVSVLSLSQVTNELKAK